MSDKENVKEEIKRKLIEEFKDDPIYKMVEFYGLVDELFTEGILGLNMDDKNTYSTTEAAKILDRPDSTIRNYFHTDLIEYIAPEKWGKFYRLDYRSIFKLRMIFVLVDKANKTSVDLLTTLGVSPSIVIGENELKRTNHFAQIELPPDLVDNLKNISDFLNKQSEIFKLFTFQNELNELRLKLNKKESERDKEISELHFRYLEDKQSAITDNYIRNLTQKSKLWRRKKANEEMALALQEQIGKLRNKYQTEIQKINQKYEIEIEELKTKITETETIIKLEQQRLGLIEAENDVESREMLVDKVYDNTKEKDEIARSNEITPDENKNNIDN